MNRFIQILGSITLLLFVSAVNTQAHRVIVYAWVEDDAIRVEAGFGGSRKAKNCPVLLQDPDGKTLAQSQTDNAGNCSFQLPAGITTDLVVVLDAGEGHRAQWVLHKSELVADPGETQVAQERAEKRKQLAGQPSVLRILTGVGLIFGLAGAILVARKLRAND